LLRFDVEENTIIEAFIRFCFAGVAITNTGDKHSFANISEIFEKIQNGPMEYLGARGTMIHEKKPEVENLMSDSL
jgi:hypothetical protein